MGNDWAVSDDGLSTNGTYCNGERVRGRRRLRDGDQLRVGRSLVAFRAPLAPDGDAVKVHLRALYRRLGIERLPQNEKRARLAELAIHRVLVSQRDLEAG